MAGCEPGRLWFVDECGTHTSLTRRYARSRRGERAVGSVPRNRGQATTLIAALTPHGLRAGFALAGGVSGEVFSVYVQRVLAPLLGPGDVVVLDNLGAHKVASARAGIEATGARLVFLPAYSPDFSPIELAFSKLKNLLRSAGARTREALLEAIATAIEAVKPEDATAYFRHCGYPLPTQPL